MKTEQTFEPAFTDTTLGFSAPLAPAEWQPQSESNICSEVIPFQHYIKRSSFHKRERDTDKLRFPD